MVLLKYDYYYCYYYYYYYYYFHRGGDVFVPVCTSVCLCVSMQLSKKTCERILMRFLEDWGVAQ